MPEAPLTCLRQAMLRNNLNQGELADLVGCSKSWISRILSGFGKVDLDLAFALQRELGIPAKTWLSPREKLREIVADKATSPDQIERAAKQAVKDGVSFDEVNLIIRVPGALEEVTA